MRGEKFPHYGQPSRLISTDPLLISAILKAVEMECKNGTMLDLYMTDLPDDGRNFFFPLQALKRYNPERLSKIRVHTVPPLRKNGTEGDAGMVATKAGVSVSQVVLEKFMPVSPAFTNGTFPRPGAAVNLSVTAHCAAEEKFLGAARRDFQIAAADE